MGWIEVRKSVWWSFAVSGVLFILIVVADCLYQHSFTKVNEKLTEIDERINKMRYLSDRSDILDHIRFMEKSIRGEVKDIKDEFNNHRHSFLKRRIIIQENDNNL